MDDISTNIDISTVDAPSLPSNPPPPTTTMEQSASTENNQAYMLPRREEEDDEIDPEILTMLEDANRAFKEGLIEQEAYNLQAELDDEALKREFELAFALLDYEEPGWDDRVWPDHHSGASSPQSVGGYGFGCIPGEFRNFDDDNRSERSDGSDNSLFREKIPPVGQRPILKPKSRVRATPAEKAASAMMPFTVSNPADIPAMTFPSNPSWSGVPILSSGQHTITFMGATTSVPVMSDTANMELVNNMGMANLMPSNAGDQELDSKAMQELNTLRQELAASGVLRAALEADVRRLEEDRGDTNLRVKDLETRLSEMLNSANGIQMAATKELQICRNALTASQQSCNTMNKENGELRRQVSELANGANELDKESNEIRSRVLELSNHVAFVNGELDSRTRERDFAVQKINEAQSHIDEAVAANNYHRQQIAIMENNAAAKDVEVRGLMTALTKAESEKQDLERKSQEVETLRAALTKAETEKQDLERKAQEEKDGTQGKEDEIQIKLDETEVKLTKSEKVWQNKCDEADERAAAATRNAEAYEQDYFDLKGQYKLADTKVTQLTENVAELKGETRRKESQIFELTQKITRLSVDLEELESSTETERTDYYNEVEKMKKDRENFTREKKYIDELLDEANEDNNILNKLAARNKKKIEELEEALQMEIDTTTSLQEQLKEARSSSKSALHVSRAAAFHRAQSTQGFPRPPREDGRFYMPTLDQQLAAWKKDDGSSVKFMEDYRRILKDNPMTPMKPMKPKNSSTRTLGSSVSPKKTSSAPQDDPATEVGPDEETANDLDDSSVTAVEPSVSGDDTVSESGDASETEIEPSMYYQGDYNTSNSSDGRGLKKRVQYVEQLVYVDKYVVVDRITEHTIHQARSPIWAFLYVYVDLWTIFAHHYPGFAAYIGLFHPVNIVGSLFSGKTSKTSRLARLDANFHGPATTKPADIDIESQTEELTVIDVESQTEDTTKVSTNFDTDPATTKPSNIGIESQTEELTATGVESKPEDPTKVDTEPDTHPATTTPSNVDVESQSEELTVIDIEAQTEKTAKAHTKPDLHPRVTVTHKLPHLWPNLLSAILQLLGICIVYQCAFMLKQRHLWLSGNEITRSAVAHYWRREPSGLYVVDAVREVGSWSMLTICYQMIRYSGYSYALPG
ncbi:hypothetical protein V493_06754 [Pseudogymnoascus sp. VKM F-4281 (FW-2241)]|nr:hypothetical protein V493_06754 [Pseudogymnoascus sp. VKM F-4281 (FW-2241)]